MNLTVNGRPIELDDSARVADLLVALDFDPEQRGIAIAINDQVIPRSEWASVQLSADDVQCWRNRSS